MIESKRKNWMGVESKRQNEKKKSTFSFTLSSAQASSLPNNSFPSKQSFGKAKARAPRGLPKSQGQEKAVLSSQLSTLSPSSKSLYLILQKRMSH